jgi:DNA-binding transcriptional LysR family regulator
MLLFVHKKIGRGERIVAYRYSGSWVAGTGNVDTSKITAFVAAADAGSLSRGAARIGARLSTMSRQIGDLEAELAAKLLVRTGRGVRVTPLGERFLARARVILTELDAAAADIRGADNEPLARLRISVPPDIGFAVLPLVLSEMARRYPDLTIESRSDARRVSIVEEEYDAAIRLGPLDDSGLVPRSLGSLSRVPCAVPDVAASLRTLRTLAGAEHVRWSS